MFRGTTPTITIHSSTDMTGWEIEIAIKNGDLLFVHNDAQILTYDDVPGCYIVSTMTQDETLQLQSGKTLEVQVRAFKDGTAVASQVFRTTVEQILRNGTIGD